ncbi:MAG: hypothetical protein NC213_09135 [Acetobacter sp.]|nr:hypothetical protein [Bacteroides sp.]MCM1341893.1 hypothetical protein [Acetobacter sp.]MCM1433190.1 hypothetical protein [Clostridiales bacterium]
MNDNIINYIFIEMQEEVSKCCLRDEEYSSAKKQSYELEKELLSELSDEQKNKLTELINSLSTTAFIESKQNFHQGLKTGANLILEILDK